MSEGMKIIFYTKPAKSSNRIIVTIPRKLQPLVDVNRTYKVTLEVVK